MRLDAHDENFDFERGKRIRVYVDGQLIPDVRMVDDEEGVVVYYPRNETGHIYVDPDDPDRPKMLTLRGKVEIVEVQ